MNYKSEVYVRTDEENRIVRVDGGCTMNNIKDILQWIKIDEGYGDKYNLCQNNYFPLPIVTEGGAYRYKLVDGKVVECSVEEIVRQEVANIPTKTYSAQDDTDAMLIDHEYRLTLLELGITE